MKKFFLSMCAALAIYAAASPARAATTGYACYAQHYNFTGLGTYGGVLISLYSAVNCGGTYLGYGYVCSVNATQNVCASSSYFLYSEAGLMAQFRSLVDAANGQKKLGFNLGTNCKGTGGTCLDNGINYY